MSYNIDSTSTPVFEAWMHAEDIVRLHGEYGDTAEGNLLADHLKDALAELRQTVQCGGCKKQNEQAARFCNACGKGLGLTPRVKPRVKLRNLWWYGEGSGHSYEDVFLKRVAPSIHGKVEAILTWEGGDSFTGLRIVDGKVTQHEVVQTLGKEIER